jgi:NAD(P)H-flavin reductase/Ca2+-binding EF-hand superfamily protein
LSTIPPPSNNQELLEMLERAFQHHASEARTIDREALQKALGLRSEYLAKRLLTCFDQNGDGVISRDEFMTGVRALVLGTEHEKLLFAFRMHDHDGDGTLSREEVLRMITISLAESEIIERPTQPPEKLTAALFALADKDKDGKIGFEELEVVVKRRPDLLHKMTRSEAIWIAPNEDLLDWMDARKRPSPSASLDGWMPLVFVLLWIVANLVIFAFAVLREGLPANGRQTAMYVGRALGTSIDFNGMLILLPMMRRLLTWLRATWVGKVIPVDEAIDFHRIVGHTLFALAMTHAGAFVFAYVLGHSTPLLDVFASLRGATGLGLLGVFFIMWFFALEFVRRTRHFELFYFTHLLYVAWLGLAITHAPAFGIWVALPIVGLMVEQLLRLGVRGKSRILKSEALRSGVIRLELEKPPGFDFGPGDFAFIRVPAIAKREWHPFTVSCAPERGTLSFHIRSLGNWTGALRRHVEEHPNDPSLVALVDGPYGSPTAHIFKSRHAVLIGAGIGVTPFASVLESLVMRANGVSKRPSSLEKAYFFWLNRDQYSFEWFTALLAEIERIDTGGFLEIHLCMTNARGGAMTLGLEAAREGMRAEGHGDLITGLRAPTHFGNPDWDGMLGTIAEKHKPHVVDVYFCGPPGLGKKIEPICRRLGMTFRTEKF